MASRRGRGYSTDLGEQGCTPALSLLLNSQGFRTSCFDLLCLSKVSVTIVIYSFEILNVHEWRSIQWVPDVFSARGKPVVSFFCWTQPALLLVWLPQVCCHPAFCEPALLLCVMQGQELVWAPRIQVSPLTFPICCTCLNCTACGKKWVEGCS